MLLLRFVALLVLVAVGLAAPTGRGALDAGSLDARLDVLEQRVAKLAHDKDKEAALKLDGAEEDVHEEWYSWAPGKGISRKELCDRFGSPDFKYCYCSNQCRSCIDDCGGLAAGNPCVGGCLIQHNCDCVGDKCERHRTC